MSKKIQLSIPKPCHENWENMTPVDKGRFCGSCQKQVVDFSRMSDREMAQFFKKPSTGSVCGRFMQDQLERDIEIPRKRIPWVKYFFQFALPAFLISIKTSAQTVRKPKEVLVCSNPEPAVATGGISIKRKPKELSLLIAKDTTLPLPVIVGDVKCVDTSGVRKGFDEIGITGRVIDSNGDGIVGTTVQVAGSDIKVRANADGYFSIHPEIGWRNITLLFSSSGYVQQKKVVDRTSDPLNTQVLMLTMEPMTRGEVVVVGYYSRKSIRKASRRAKRQEKIAPVQPIVPVIENKNVQLKAFPNPVSKGGSVTVETISGKENSLVLKIVALDGRLVASQSLHAVKGINRFPVVTGHQWPGGVYYIQLLDENSKVIATEQIIIQ